MVCKKQKLENGNYLQGLYTCSVVPLDQEGQISCFDLDSFYSGVSLSRKREIRSHVYTAELIPDRKMRNKSKNFKESAGTLMKGIKILDHLETGR